MAKLHLKAQLSCYKAGAFEKAATCVLPKRPGVLSTFEGSHQGIFLGLCHARFPSPFSTVYHLSSLTATPSPGDPLENHTASDYSAGVEPAQTPQLVLLAPFHRL